MRRVDSWKKVDWISNLAKEKNIYSRLLEAAGKRLSIKAGPRKIYPGRECVYRYTGRRGKNMMEKNVMAEGEELGVNKRLIPDELVSFRLLHNTVCFYLLICDIFI